MGDRVSEALVPPATAIGEGARAAPVHYSDETSGLLHGERNGLGVRANPLGAYFPLHPTRSQVALMQRMAAWTGVLVSDGYLVSQHGQGLRQSCLAHLIRTAQGLAAPLEAGIAGCGRRGHAE
jgi:Transposase IS66 family